MTINLSVPETQCLKPRITVIGVGGAGGNAVNNMIACGLQGVEFITANTDAQALNQSTSERKIQLGHSITQGLGAGSRPDIGKAAAEEAMEEIMEQLIGSHMVFITAGLGGGTGTGATPVVARAAREQGMLTVGVVTKPFHFEGAQRMRLADEGLRELQQFVDTLIIIPNQNLFRVANDQTTFADAFKMADDVLHAGVRGVTDLMVQPGLINLDFADVRTVMSEMGKAMMGTGEADGEQRALEAAEAAIANPLLDEVSMKGARGVLINITGGPDMTLFEVDEAANRIRDEVDSDANIIFGAAFDDSMEGSIRVSLVATGIEAEGMAANPSGRPSLTAIEGGQSIRSQPQPDRSAPAAASLGQHALQLKREQIAEPAEPVDEEVVEPVEDSAVEPEPVAQTDLEAAIEAGPVDDVESAEPESGPEPEPEPEAEPAASDSFIAPRPVEAPTAAEPAGQPDPFAAAALSNGGREQRRPSLFERMTGTGRAREQREDDRPRQEPAVVAAPRPASTARPEAPVTPEPRQAAPTPAPAPKPVQKDFLSTGRSEEPDTTQSVEDDVLDIPAFLRRQAN